MKLKTSSIGLKMLVVKVELHSAVTGEVKLLQQAIISNDGTSLLPDVGNYEVRLGHEGEDNIKEVWENPRLEGKVDNYLRMEEDVWSLVRKAIEEVGL